MAPRPTGITRRGLMGAMGGALAGGALAGVAHAGDPMAALVASDAGADGAPVSEGGIHPSTVPDRTAATSYLNLGLWDFRSNDPAVPGVLGVGYVSAPGKYLECPLRLPAGTKVTELTVWANNSSGSGAAVNLYGWANDGTSALLYSISVPIGTTYSTPLTYNSGAVTLQPGYFYTIDMATPSSSVGIRAARVGMENTGTYVPVSPYRCYDSRFGVSGKVAPNTTRLLDVTLAFDPVSGDPLWADTVPASARAITFNLQAVQATGANNFAIANGGAVAANASHIVFNSSTPTVANAGTVDIADGMVKVFGGGGPGSAHCILDITGYYV